MIVSGDIQLVECPVDKSKDLLIEFASKDKHGKMEIPELVEGMPLVKHVWLGKTRGVIGGILFLCYLENRDWWTLDAYKNDKLLKEMNNRGDYSFRAGKMVIDWFFENKNVNRLYTIHDVKNKPATIVCERLGFETDGFLEAFIIQTIWREKWALRQR